MSVILVVDDHFDTARTTARLIADAGHTVHLAHSGSDAIAVIQQQCVDLLILDGQMPEMDGIEVLNILRRAASGNGRDLFPYRVPVVIMFSASEELRSTARHHGAAAFICKSNYGQLLSIVRKHLPKSSPDPHPNDTA